MIAFAIRPIRQILYIKYMSNHMTLYTYTDIQIYRYKYVNIYRYTHICKDIQIYRYTYIHVSCTSDNLTTASKLLHPEISCSSAAKAERSKSGKSNRPFW